MKKKRIVGIFVIVLVIIEITSIFLMYKSNNKETQLDNVKLNEVDKYSGIALMIEQEDGTYTTSESTSWPTKGYKLNQRLSGCIDGNGNTVENALSYENSILKIRTKVNTSCYLYFDTQKVATEELIATAGDDLWKSTIEDDGYRYVGTDPNNYVCFGYSDATTDCDFTNTTNSDLYAYRIIGIFEDSEGQQHLKLIKKEALNTYYVWNADYKNDVSWEESDLYTGINGSYFLTNTTYSYMQDSTWTNKIAEWTWTATNTQTYYIGSSTSNVGAYYYYSWPIGIYNSEHKINTTTGCYQEESGSAINCTTTAAYTYPEAKIGLMYASDYALSLGETAASMTGSIYTNMTTLKTGWMHMSNNDTGAPHSYEWTMSRNGTYSGGNYAAWTVRSIGRVDYSVVHNTFSVRPVFYLTSYVELKEGMGTIENPYIINNDTSIEELIATAGDDLWESTLEDDGYRYVGTDPSNYICFGYSDASTDCDFTNTSNSDLYAYRIIGIFEGTDGEQHLKLIKKEALNTTYAWNADYENDIAWNASDLYTGINGSYFLTNTDYSYMQDSTWTNKIATWNYTTTNTKTYESSGPDYYNGVTVQNIYLHEMNRNTKSSTVGEWDTVSAKIGLMYVSDYALSLGETAASMIGSTYTNRTTLKTGWMHISNNDSGTPSSYEWTMSRYGASSYGWYGAWRVVSAGNVAANGVDLMLSVRPVFYLTSDVKISGEGTSGSPFIIS